MKLQWSIQPSYTQLALDKVTHLNYRNTHIWPPTKLDYITCEAFHLAPHKSYHLIFLNQYISLWDQCLKFLIFQFDELAFGFLGIIYFILRRFPFFLANTSMCDKLLQLNISFHLEIYILKVQLVYKTLWMFRPPIYKLPIQA